MKIINEAKSTWKNFVDNEMKVTSFIHKKFTLSIDNDVDASISFEVKNTHIEIKNYTIYVDINGGSFKFTPSKNSEVDKNDNIISVYNKKNSTTLKIYADID